MNITLNTNNFNTQYSQYNRAGQKKTPAYYNNNNYNHSFTGINPIDALPTKSKFLGKFKDAIKGGFDKFTTGIARFYTTKLYTSPFALWLAKHTDKLSGVVDHMQVAGSVIISGMYMLKTLNNDDFDEDRKKTLAVNQGLTFAVSTFGSYLIDSKLDNIWEKFTQRYASKQLGDSKLSEKIAKLNEPIIKEAEKKFGKPWKKLSKRQKPKLIDTLKYIEDNVPNTGIESKIRGMGVLKKLLVFGTVYRFISPVAVTPFASMISNKFFAKSKKSADQDKTQDKNVKPEENKKVAA